MQQTNNKQQIPTQAEVWLAAVPARRTHFWWCLAYLAWFLDSDLVKRFSCLFSISTTVMSNLTFVVCYSYLMQSVSWPVPRIRSYSFSVLEKQLHGLVNFREMCRLIIYFPKNDLVSCVTCQHNKCKDGPALLRNPLLYLNFLHCWSRSLNENLCWPGNLPVPGCATGVALKSNIHTRRT